jgi:hypothetical protein
MGDAPDQEECKGQHGNAPVDTFGIPDVIVKVFVSFPKLEVGVLLSKKLEHCSRDPGDAGEIALKAKPELVHCRDNTSVKNR